MIVYVIEHGQITNANVHQMFIHLPTDSQISPANDTKDDTNVHKELTERQREIISFVKEDCTITSQKISQKLSQKNRATTRTIIADMFLLQQMGYLRREGGRKNGRWVIENRK